jgi:hypothetical protein
MKASDLFRSILIILSFIVLYFVTILSIGVSNIKDQWAKYRCNPIIMPFASAFGQNPSQNFTYCIQTAQSNYMNYLTQPIHYNLSVMGDSVNVLTESVQSARAFMSNLRDFITSITQNIFGVFLNMLIEFQKTTIQLKDMMAKLVGVLATMLYTLDGSVKTMNSVWSGPPGKTVRALGNVCFHPSTLIQLQDGTYHEMKDIPLNSVLKNGAIVQSVMKISNLNNTTNTIETELNNHHSLSFYKEQIYEIDCGEKDKPIYITGSHLIYDTLEQKYVQVQELSKVHPYIRIARSSLQHIPELACLITSNHTIPIGPWIFHDWEDNQGSASKTL